MATPATTYWSLLIIHNKFLLMNSVGN